MSEEITGWHIREIDGEERKWSKDGREEAIEDYEEFAGEDFVGTIEVVDPEGRIVKSEAEQTDTEELQERVDAEVVDMTKEENKPNTNQSEASEKEFGPGHEQENEMLEHEDKMAEGYKQRAQEETTLPDKPPVDTDPLEWVPTDFVDHIEGKPAINRKGYEVLAHHYNISVETEKLISPNETDFEYAEIEATATTETGEVYKAHGSAHVDRGDDSFLLLEMADTRAAKRAIARATGVGMVAVEELQNEL